MLAQLEATVVNVALPVIRFGTSQVAGRILLAVGVSAVRAAGRAGRYLRFNLSYRDVEELLAERGIEADHVTVFRWVQRFTPLLADTAWFCRHAPGDRWHGGRDLREGQWGLEVSSRSRLTLIRANS